MMEDDSSSDEDDEDPLKGFMAASQVKAKDIDKVDKAVSTAFHAITNKRLTTSFLLAVPKAEARPARSPRGMDPHQLPASRSSGSRRRRHAHAPYLLP